MGTDLKRKVGHALGRLIPHGGGRVVNNKVTEMGGRRNKINISGLRNTNVEAALRPPSNIIHAELASLG